MMQRILSGAAFGTSWLFFGCRRRDQDFLYGSLLEAWASEGHIQLSTAFSRQQVSRPAHLACTPSVWREVTLTGVCGRLGGHSHGS